MTIPIFNKTALPCIQYPMKVTQEQSMRFLGGRAITGGVYVEMSLLAKSDAEEKALYDFWKDSCNFGLEPFLIALPIFGNTFDEAHPDLLVQFVGDVSDNKEKGRWTTKRKLKVMGTLDYIIDVNGDFIVTSAGEYTVTAGGDYIPTGNIINTYREVVYGQ